MTNINKSKRISFLDLAKGLCILILVIGHCGVDINIPYFNTYAVSMALFFVLSGMFFKDYGDIFKFIVNKTNKILIPFLFFYFISYVPYYIFEHYLPGLIKTDAKGLLDVFNNRQYFNGPIWFLICLFWTNIIFSIISLNIQQEISRALLCVIIGIIGFTLGRLEIFLPCMFDVAMTALPFFYFGYLLKKTKLLVPNRYDKFNLLFLLFFVGLSVFITWLFNNPYISFHYNRIQGNILVIYVLSVSSVLAVLILCKTFGDIPVLSYIGRYSLIVLCIHHLIYRPLYVFFSKFDISGVNYLVTFITVCICMLCIPICKKYIPYFTAQKDLINIKILRKWT